MWTGQNALADNPRHHRFRLLTAILFLRPAARFSVGPMLNAPVFAPATNDGMLCPMPAPPGAAPPGACPAPNMFDGAPAQHALVNINSVYASQPVSAQGSTSCENQPWEPHAGTLKSVSSERWRTKSWSRSLASLCLRGSSEQRCWLPRSSKPERRGSPAESIARCGSTCCRRTKAWRAERLLKGSSWLSSGHGRTAKLETRRGRLPHLVEGVGPARACCRSTKQAASRSRRSERGCRGSRRLLLRKGR